MLTTLLRAMLAASTVLVALPSVAAKRPSEPGTPMTPQSFAIGYYSPDVHNTFTVCHDAGIDVEAYRDIVVANGSSNSVRAGRVLPWIGYDEDANAAATHQEASLRTKTIQHLQWLATHYGEPGNIRAGCESLARHAGELATADVFTARFPGAWKDIPSGASTEGGGCVVALRVAAPSYPPAALRNHEQGTVVIGVTLDSEGHVIAGEITSSSGSRWLDRATVMQSAQWQFDVSTCLRSFTPGNPRVAWVPLTFKLPF